MPYFNIDRAVTDEDRAAMDTLLNQEQEELASDRNIIVGASAMNSPDVSKDE